MSEKKGPIGGGVEKNKLKKQGNQKQGTLKFKASANNNIDDDEEEGLFVSKTLTEKHFQENNPPDYYHPAANKYPHLHVRVKAARDKAKFVVLGVSIRLNLSANLPSARHLHK